MNKARVVVALTIIAVIVFAGFLFFLQPQEEVLQELAAPEIAEPLSDVEDHSGSQPKIPATLHITDESKSNSSRGRISGRTYILPDREPLEGAQVTLVRSDMPTVSSDVDGSFEFADLPPGTYFLQATPPSASSLVPSNNGEAMQIILDWGERIDDILIGFVEGVALHGQVYDATTNAGIANGTVTLECYYAKGDLEELITRVLTTDDRGNFSAKGLPAVGIIEMRARAEAYALGKLRNYEGPLEGISPVRLPLSPGAGGIEGIVRDSDGVPLAGFSLSARSSGSSPQKATSNDGGNFVIENLNPGTWTIYYSKELFVEPGGMRMPKRRTDLAVVEVFSALISEVELIVDTYTGHVKGSVIDEMGAPISGVSIFQDWVGPVEFVTDESGAFEVSILNAKQDFVRLVARHPQYGETISEPIVLGENNAKIAFTRGGMIEGRVTAKHDGEPIQSFVVQAVVMREDGEVAWADVPLQTNFRSTKGTFILGPLEPGRYEVVAWSDGFGKSLPTAVVVVSGEASEHLDISLLPEKKFIGTVVDAATGDPIGAVYISMADASGGLVDAIAVSDKQGKFEIPNLTVGEFIIQMTHTDYVTSEARIQVGISPETQRRFTMSMGAEIYGAVYVNGTLKSEASVRVVSADGTIQLQVTDDSGSYRFGNMATGHYRLIWHDESGEEQFKDLQLEAGSSVEENVFITSATDEEATMEQFN